MAILDLVKIRPMLSSDRKIVRRVAIFWFDFDRTFRGQEQFSRAMEGLASGLVKDGDGLTTARDPSLFASAQCILSVMTMLSKSLTKKQQVDHLNSCDNVSPRVVNVLKKVLSNQD